MQGTGNKIKMPWWFWFAAVLGAFSFVPLLIAGSKTKNNLWIGWGIVQGLWLFFGPADGILFDLEMLFWIASAIFVFTVVRKKYLTELEIQAAMNPPQHTHQYNTSDTPNPDSSIKAWTCTSCGASNKNFTGDCEYCGVAMK